VADLSLGHAAVVMYRLIRRVKQSNFIVNLLSSTVHFATALARPEIRPGRNFNLHICGVSSRTLSKRR